MASIRRSKRVPMNPNFSIPRTGAFGSIRSKRYSALKTALRRNPLFKTEQVRRRPSVSESNKKVYITTKELDAAKANLLAQIRRSGRQYDGVVCIASGGLELGPILANNLGKVLGIISCHRYFKAGERKEPFVNPNIFWLRPLKKRPKRILLVDDLIDQGTTMKLVTGVLSDQGFKPKNVDICVIYTKPNKLEVDLSMHHIFSHRPVEGWIVFPSEAREAADQPADTPSRQRKSRKSPN